MTFLSSGTVGALPALKTTVGADDAHQHFGDLAAHRVC
jgi:hypothetical protein